MKILLKTWMLNDSDKEDNIEPVALYHSERRCLSSQINQHLFYDRRWKICWVKMQSSHNDSKDFMRSQAKSTAPCGKRVQNYQSLAFEPLVVQAVFAYYFMTPDPKACNLWTKAYSKSSDRTCTYHSTADTELTEAREQKHESSQRKPTWNERQMACRSASLCFSNLRSRDLQSAILEASTCRMICAQTAVIAQDEQ